MFSTPIYAKSKKSIFKKHCFLMDRSKEITVEPVIVL